MQPSTLCDIYFQAIEKPKDAVLRYKSGGVYRTISTAVLARSVQAINLYLASLGLAKGDKIALLSYNRPEWAIADWAILTMGAITVPLHTSSLVEQIKYILSECGAKAIFVENNEHYEKIVESQKDTPHLKYIISFEDIPGVKTFSQAVEDGSRIADTAIYRERAKDVLPSDLATIIYTSGTTGVPKGVMLSHANLTSNLTAFSAQFEFSSGDSGLSFLPTSHIFQRIVDYACFYKGATISYAESVEKVLDNLAEVKPTVFTSVPRFYEKVKAKFDQKTVSLPMKWLLLPLLAKKLKGVFGGNIRLLISGGAHLPESIAHFFARMRLPIYEGYGLTETSPVIATNTRWDFKPGTIGKPIPGVKIKVADDGELLIQGPNVMVGYYNKPDETNEVMKDGWFHTGDIVELDSEGFLKVIDRKKDLLKTSGGKYVAPQPIEDKLKSSPFIKNAVVVGDGRKFVSALIVPDFQFLEEFARKNNEGYTGKDSLENAGIKELYAKELAKINESLPSHETVKKFHLLDDDFQVSTGELTLTFKTRRRKIEERYKAAIDALYK